MPSKRLNSKIVSQPSSSAVQLSFNFSSLEEISEKVISDSHMLEQLLDQSVSAIKDVVKVEEINPILLPLLFYKYLSDLFETPSLVSNSLNFPSEYRWEAIWNHQNNETTGQFIHRAMHTLVRLNSRLRGVLDFANYEELSDITLKRLVGVISGYRLIKAYDLDLWSEAYEYMLQRFPEKKQSSGMSLYTPRDIVKLMVDLIKPEPDESFYDPACSSGCLSSLFHCLNLKQAEQKGGPELIGQDEFSVASAVVGMNLLFYDNAKINNSNALYKPLFENNALKRCRYIFANPPWNQSGHDDVFYKNNSYKRFQYGIPPRKSADWGWIQHILASLAENNGQAAVILDLGTVSRGSGKTLRDRERDIKRAIIEKDVIEAVISLPGNLFYGTTAPCCLLLLNVTKMSDRKGKILFVDMLNPLEIRRSSKRIGLKQAECDTIVEAYSRWKTIENFSCVTSLEETYSYDYDLSPALYVPKKIEMHYRPLDAIQQELAEAVQEQVSSDLKILEHLNCRTEEEFHLVDILDTRLSGLKSGRLDKALCILLNNAVRSRKRELAFAIEERETVSRDLFVFETASVRLGTCARIHGGFTPDKRERERDGQRIPWVKAGDLEQEFVIEAEDSLPEILTTNDPYSSAAIRPEDTLLLALYGGASTIGKTAILGISAVTNQSVCCITPFQGDFDSDYLFCYLTYIRKSWMRYAQGSRQNIYLQVVRNHLVPCPDSKQQSAIVAKLRPHNEKICELKREIAVLQRILKA